MSPTNQILANFTHIIFDIDGTLVDTANTSVLSFQKTLKDILGMDLSYEETYPYFGIPSHRVLEMLPFKDKHQALEIWEANFRALFHLIKPFDGIINLLKNLKEAGYHIGVVSSRSKAEFDFDHNLKEMLPYFEEKICAEDSILHKPNPDPLLEYIHRTGAKKEECIYIGDTDYDYLCAKNAGIKFALAQWGVPPQINLKKHPHINQQARQGADYILNKVLFVLS